MKCPSCGSTDIRLSKRRPRASAVFRLLGYRRFRCRTCGRSFWRMSVAAPPAEVVAARPAEKVQAARPSGHSRFLRRRRRLLNIEVILFVVLLAIFVVAIRYLMNRRADASGAPAPRVAESWEALGPPGTQVECAVSCGS